MIIKFLLLWIFVQALCVRIPLEDWSLSGIYGGSPSSFQVKVPSTLFGGILDAGYLKDDPNFGLNLKEYYKKNMTGNPWTYETNFTLEVAPASVKSVKLVLEGVNYRANVWVNNKLVGDASKIAGPFRLFSIEISSYVQYQQTNKVRVEVFAPWDDTFPDDNNSTDLSMTFIDWLPAPPDASVGLWRPAYVEVSANELSAQFPIVQTRLLENGSAVLNISFTVCNPGSKIYFRSTQAFVSVGPVFHKTLPRFTPGECRKVELNDCLLSEPKLWWPWHMGKPELTELKVWFTTDSDLNYTVIDTKFGVREVYSKLNENGFLQFFINHKYVQIRGGGWTPDLYLRSDNEKIRTQMLLTIDLNLNSIRLEGKMESEYFYNLADEMGILLLPGWQCCDAWQHWKNWGPEQMLIAKESMRSQAQRLAIHPSVIVFLYSSDKTPPQNVEQIFLDALAEEKWPNPTLSSASASPSEITGPSGVKMSGPYSWVPPNYWLLDNEADKRKFGGAWGFLTEGGPGESPMTLQSWRRTVPSDQIWSEDGSLGEAWKFHSGNAGGEFGSLSRFTEALENRYGNFSSAETYLYASQVASYEGIRSMFESYSRNKHEDATGLIQWMLNNGYPCHIWNLYDYYFVGGGPYYAAKRAGEAIHAMVSYTDGSVWLYNSLFNTVDEEISLSAAIVDLNGTTVWETNDVAPGLNPDESKRTNITVPISGNPWYSMPNETFFVVLRWSLSNQREKSNWYWLTPKQDVLDWDQSTFYNTKVVEFADFSALASLNPVSLSHNVTFANSSVSVTVSSSNLLNAQPAVAFFVSVRLVNKTSALDISPLMWDDNFFSLLPGESKTISSLLFDPAIKENEVDVVVESWNNVINNNKIVIQ